MIAPKITDQTYRDAALASIFGCYSGAEYVDVDDRSVGPWSILEMIDANREDPGLVSAILSLKVGEESDARPHGLCIRRRA